MSDQSEPLEDHERDLIDRIANELPVEVRAEYYRELRHCRSLPYDDEMLRIIRAMQFSVLLMVDVPKQITTERRQFDEILRDAIKALQAIRESSATQQVQLDRRLAQLPANVAEGIKPEKIVATINESLRQQFVQSTIPETAGALAVASAQIKKAASDFAGLTRELGSSYNGAAVEAQRAVRSLESTCTEAVSRTQHSAQELVKIFRDEYRWSIVALTGVALAFGFGTGMWFHYWISPAGH